MEQQPKATPSFFFLERTAMAVDRPIHSSFPNSSATRGDRQTAEAKRPTPPHTRTMYQLDGYLVKRGLRVKSWKRRFFTFRDGVLTYKKDHREGTKIIKRDEVTNVLYWGGVKHGFCVHLGSGRELYLSAATEEEAGVWYNVFDAFVRRQMMNKEFMRLMCKRHLDPIVESSCEC